MMEFILKLVCEVSAEACDLEVVNLILRSVPRLGRKTLADEPWNTLIKTPFKRIVTGDYFVEEHLGYVSITTYKTGCKLWRHGNFYHRLDGPAIEDKRRGREEWYYYGKLHRNGGPAVSDYTTGVTEWWRHGKLHRDDGPAVIDEEGEIKMWYKNGLIHRDRRAAVISPQGREYYRHGVLIDID